MGSKKGEEFYVTAIVPHGSTFTKVQLEIIKKANGIGFVRDTKQTEKVTFLTENPKQKFTVREILKAAGCTLV